MTEGYHKARRQLVLFSGILVAWEYVGISIGDGSSVTATVPVGETPVTIRNPEVLPVVILTLILYFAYRLGVEWYQSDKKRRGLLVSRLDLAISGLMAGGAILLFIFQQTSAFRLADALTPLTFAGAVAGVVWVVAGSRVAAWIIMPQRLLEPEYPYSISRRNKFIYTYLVGLAVAVVVALVTYLFGPSASPLAPIQFLTSVLTVVGLSANRYFLTKRNNPISS